MIPIANMPTKAKISFNFKTFFKIISSGSDMPITDIIKARAVPSGTPFSINEKATGTAPAVQEYRGTPIKTDNGTAYHVDLCKTDTK